MKEKVIDWKMENLPKLFYEWCKEADVHRPIGYKHDFDEKVLMLYTCDCGRLIGFHGQLIKKYQDILRLIPQYKEFSFEMYEVHGFANFIIPGKKHRK